MKDTKAEVIAHKGGAGENPENTLKAFREASESKVVDGIETDIRETLDGTLIAFHDNRLGQNTDMRGWVSRTPYDELKSAKVLGSEYNIPTLEEVFETVKEDTDLVLEVKHKDSQMGKRVANMAQKYPHDVTISSSHPEAIQDLESYDVSTGYIAEENYLNRIFRVLPSDLPEWTFFPQNTKNPVQDAVDSGCDIIYSRMEMALRTDIVEYAKDTGLEVSVWTARNESEYQRLEEYDGIDSIITDKYQFLERLN